MKKKRILSWLIALAMAVSMLPTVAFAANAYEITAPGVVGTFNDWLYDDLMTESQPGIWEVIRNSISGNFEFKIRNEKAWDFSFGGTFTDFGEAFDVSVSSSSAIAVTVEGTKDLKFVLDLTGYNSETGTGAKVSVVDVTAKPEYTITFDANGGAVSTATAQTVSGKLASLPNATLENHIFDGWFTEKTGGDLITTDTVFDKDTTVYAQYTKAYDIYVAGIQVTEKNAADVLGNADESASVVYDALSNTLTLNGCTAEGTDTHYSPVEAYDDLTVELKGVNNLYGYDGGTGTTAGISVAGNLTVKGNGTLNTIGGDGSGHTSAGISIANGDLVIKDGCTVNATGQGAQTYSAGINNESGKVTVESATLNASGGNVVSGPSSGIYASEIDLKNASVTATGNDAALRNSLSEKPEIVLGYEKGYNWKAASDGSLTSDTLDWSSVGTYFHIEPTPVYTVTFETNGGSAITSQQIAQGDTCTEPTAPTRDGYTFSGWYTDEACTNEYDFSAAVTESFTLYAKWTEVSDDTNENVNVNVGGGGSSFKTYTVRFETNGGSTVTSKTVAAKSKLPKPTAPTKEGYTFAGWYTDSGLTQEYDFSEAVTKGFVLYAKWTGGANDGTDGDGSTEHGCPSLAFNDLNVDMWYHLDTDYVIGNGLMKGIAAKTFAPNANFTRAMLVTVLYREEGEPQVSTSSTFADVKSGSWYDKAVAWAQANGIVKGYSATEFKPEKSITREQFAVIMYRYAQYKGYDVSVGERTDISSYADYSSVSGYAVDAMKWAVGSGLINGRSATTLNPLNTATRVEAAAILHRFIENN